MLDLLKDYVLSGIVTALFALFTFLVRHYFSSIRKDIKHLDKAVTKLDARFDAMQKDMRENIKEISGLAAQTKALWRFIDGSHERASDYNGGESQ